MLILCGCSDDASSMYSNREYVYCLFDKIQYNELNLVMPTLIMNDRAMDNMGQYVSIRKHVVGGVTKITMTCSASSTDYNLNAQTKNFGFGLGGLIIGTNNFGEMLCYDLACPRCDRADRRLTLTNDGYAKCAKCGVIFLLENGTPYKVPEGVDFPVNTKLYRYRFKYNGQIVNAYN